MLSWNVKLQELEQRIAKLGVVSFVLGMFASCHSGWCRLAAKTQANTVSRRHEPARGSERAGRISSSHRCSCDRVGLS